MAFWKPEDWERKILSTYFSKNDLKDSEYCTSAELEPEHLDFGDIEENLEDYYSDYDIEDIKEIKGTPNVYVFKKDPPLKIDSDDIYSRLEHDLCDNDADNFDNKKIDELLVPLNEYIKKTFVTYSAVGVVNPDEVKPIWEKLLKEWIEEGE